MSRSTFLLLTTLITVNLAIAQKPSDLLPPPPVWSGKTRALAVAKTHPWATPWERSGLTDSPSYDVTMAWITRLVQQHDTLEMITIGKTLQGRDLVVVIASQEGAYSSKTLRGNGKPTLFVHAGIHSGEIDGKDAGMMLLRDLIGSKKALLEGTNLLFLPILNADGHERTSPYNRINQRGPSSMGWRTNGRNLNLNRDFAKLETPELQALIAFLDEWDPDLYFDVHVTDGIDYQYDITYGFTGPQGHSPAAATWMREVMTPALDGDLKAADHVPGPLVFAMDRLDLSKGIADWTAGPRYSNGYGDARHLPTVLVENHSLKPYDQRVLGTYVLLEAAMKVLAKDGLALREATAKDRERRPNDVTLTFKPGTPKSIDFLGIEGEKVTSELTSATYIKWNGKPKTTTIPFHQLDQPDITVTRPKGYWIPSDWPEIIVRLQNHGVAMEIIPSPRTMKLQLYRLVDPKPAKSSFEGRFRLSTKVETEEQTVRMPAGSAWVPTDQPLCELIVLLLEPLSPDSFLQWGFFHEILQSTEYFEAYAMEPLAKIMYEQNAGLRKEYDEKVANDPEFAKDPRARLDFFYRKTAFADKHWKRYPIGRVMR